MFPYLETTITVIIISNILVGASLFVITNTLLLIINIILSSIILILYLTQHVGFCCAVKDDKSAVREIELVGGNESRERAIYAH